LTTPEKEQLLQQILGALGQELAATEYGGALARRLAGLDELGPQTDSPGQTGSKEVAGYSVPRQPANRPSSVAKSAEMQEFLQTTRAQIRVLASRIEALVERQRSQGR
jgi:hypothetical protein